MDNSLGANVVSFNATSTALWAIIDAARDTIKRPMAEKTLQTAHSAVRVASRAAGAVLAHLPDGGNIHLIPVPADPANIPTQPEGFTSFVYTVQSFDRTTTY